MATSILTLLNDQQLSLTDVSRDSGIGLSTLSTAIKRPVETWSLRIINGLAKSLFMKPGDLVDEIQDLPYQLMINDQKQTIQGVYIANKSDYMNIKFVVKSTAMEGWQPEAQDIRRLRTESEDKNSIRKQRAQSILSEEQ
ncbi:MAG TPA: XRE family transcriptional regulator [Lactobacillus sp.]|nr:XRE family transcriptional regulator [Lactobacillus sp.]